MLIKKYEINDKYIFELAKIFREKGWELDEVDADEYSVFDIFCTRMQLLKSDTDRDLIIELTKNYLIINMDDYGKHLMEATRLFARSNSFDLGIIDTIHIFPIHDDNKKGISKTKSGNIICYMLQGFIFRRLSFFRNKRVRIIETYDALQKHKDEIKLLLLVDDYVGSGDTALGCISRIEEIGVSKDKMHVMAIVMQEYSRKLLEKYGIKTYSSLVKNKAISDNYAPEEASKKIEQMRNISKQIKAPADLELGYKNTEALVSMIKTPNNTLPFYWYENSKAVKNYAPFSRKGNVGVDE